MFWNEWLPYCLVIGISEELFGSMNPRRMKPYVKAYEQRQKKELQQANFVAYLQGMYFLEAIGSAFNKNSRYPSEPYDLGLTEDTNGKATEELTEEQKAEKVRQLFMSLRVMQINYNSEHANKDDTV